MNEADLVKIREALEKETLSEAIETMEKTLKGLGYEKSGTISQKNKATCSYNDK